MKLSWLLACSLVANIVLGSALMKHHSASRTAVNSLDHRNETEPSTWDASEAGAPGTSNAEPGPPRWKNFQTRDLAEMIRRLRQAGCPEEVVQDLVLAEVDREYSARMRAIPSPGRDNPYWKSMRFDGNAKEWREANKARQELAKEKSQRLVDLLGVDPEKEHRKAEGLPDYTGFNYLASRVDFLPESKREAAMDYLDKFEEKMQDFYRETRGLWDSETRAQQRALEAERLQGLSQFLTPDELREYELRNSQLASQLTYDLRNLSLTREQYEAIYDLRKKYGDSLMNFSDTMDTPNGPAQVAQAKEAFAADLTQALGSDFTKEYDRAQDYNYQQLVRLAKRNDLPSETAASIYDLKTEAENAAKTLRQSNPDNREERQSALQDLRTRTEQQVKATLGDTVYQKYIGNGGWWINNLAPNSTPRPRPK